MSYFTMWTDDCGDFAIAKMASLIYPYIYRTKETIEGLYLIRKTGSDPVYEWWFLDTQLTLDDFDPR